MARARPTAKNSGMMPNSLHKYGSIKKIPANSQKTEVDKSFSATPRETNTSASPISPSPSNENQTNSILENGDDQDDVQILSEQEFKAYPIPIAIKVDLSIFGNDYEFLETRLDQASDNYNHESQSESEMAQEVGINDSEMFDTPQIIAETVRSISNDHDLNKVTSSTADHNICDPDRKSAFQFQETPIDQSSRINIVDRNDTIVDSTTGNILQKRKLEKDTEEFKFELKIKKRSNSVASVRSSTSNSSSSQKRQPKTEELPLSTLISKKRWKDAVFKMNKNLDGQDKIYPTPFEFAQFLTDCGIKTRKNTTYPSEVMDKLRECVSFENIKNYEFVLEAIGSVSMELDEQESFKSNCYWPFLDELFKNMQLEVSNANSNKKTLGFMRPFVDLLEETFTILLKKPNIQLIPPVIVRMFEGYCENETLATRKDNLKFNILKLLNYMEMLKNYPQEFGILFKLFNILTVHYFHQYTMYQKQLLNLITEEFAKRSDYGLNIIRRTTSPSFGQEICLSLLLEVFSGLGELDNFLEHPERKRKDEAKLSKEKLEKRLFLFVDYMSETSLIKRRNASKEDIKFGPLTENLFEIAKKRPPNGETILHQLCGNKKVEKFTLAYALDVIRQTEEGNISVNITDNAGNTMLHEAAFHGRKDCLELIRRKCCGQAQCSRLVINAIQSTNDGDTALHYAARKGKLDIVKIVVDIVGTDLEHNFYMKNFQGKTPLACAKNKEVYSYLASLRESLSPWEDECPIKLSSKSFQRVKEDSHLKELVWFLSYFRNLNDNSKKQPKRR